LDGVTPGKEAAAKKHSAMFLVDSDFDTDDEEYGDDIEEVISSQAVNSIVSEDETQNDKLEINHDDDDDSDDLQEQVRALPNSPKGRTTFGNFNKANPFLQGGLAGKNPFLQQEGGSS